MSSSKTSILLIKFNIIKISIGFWPEANVIVQDLIQHIRRIIFFRSSKTFQYIGKYQKYVRYSTRSFIKTKIHYLKHFTTSISVYIVGRNKIFITFTKLLSLSRNVRIDLYKSEINSYYYPCRSTTLQI